MVRYTKEMFKKTMGQYLNGNYDPVVVANKTSAILFNNRADIDFELEEFMLDIITMEDGPEFEMTEKEFREFLDNM